MSLLERGQSYGFLIPVMTVIHLAMMIQEHYKLTFVHNQKRNFKENVGSTNNFYFLLSENFHLMLRFALGGYVWLSWDSSQYAILQLWA